MEPLPQPHDPNLQAAILSLPLWQQRYLAALQAGVPHHQACTDARVSVFTLGQALKASSLLARCQQAIMAGVSLMGVANARHQAASHAPHLVEHFADKATTAKHDRDQVAAGRVVLEAAGVLGRPQETDDEREKALDMVAAMRRMMMAQRRAELALESGQVVEGTGTASKDTPHEDAREGEAQDGVPHDAHQGESKNAR